MWGQRTFGGETLEILRSLLLDQGGAAIATGQPAAAAQAAPVFVYGSLLSGLHNHHRLG